MEYLLDTNICVFLLRGKYGIDEKIRGVGLNHCHISEITYAELLFGIQRSKAKEENRRVLDILIDSIDVIPISEILEQYAISKDILWENGTPVDDFDLLIGVTAVSRNMVMVTENMKHFINIPDIQLQNWVKR